MQYIFARWLWVMALAWLSAAHGEGNKCQGGEPIALAANDSRAWESFVDEVALTGAEYERLRELEPLIRAMPADVSARLSARIGARYAEASLRKVPSGASQFDPKRSLDTLIKFLVDADALFKQGKAHGVSVLATYQKFLDRVKPCLGAGPFGGYSAADILTVACAVHRAMKEFPSPKRGSFDPSLTLYGSFVNGRADLAVSDLDISALNVTNLTAIYASAYHELRSALEARCQNLALGFSFHAGALIVAGELARKNPLMIRVTEGSVTVEVFPTGHVGGVTLPETYPLACP